MCSGQLEALCTDERKKVSENAAETHAHNWKYGLSHSHMQDSMASMHMFDA